MKFAELIPDSRFSAYDSGQDAASVAKAWDALAMASDAPAALSAVLREDVRSDVPGEPAVCGGAVEVVAAAQSHHAGTRASNSHNRNRKSHRRRLNHQWSHSLRVSASVTKWVQDARATGTASSFISCFHLFRPFHNAEWCTKGIDNHGCPPAAKIT